MKEEKRIKLLNIDYIPGKEIDALGIVKGTTVQSKNFGKDFMSGMKSLVGGEIKDYTQMLLLNSLILYVFDSQKRFEGKGNCVIIFQMKRGKEHFSLFGCYSIIALL